MGELKLHDIKPLVEVPDNSLLWFIVTLVVSTIVLGLIFLAVYRFIKRKKAFNWQAFYLKELQALSLSDSKEAAYKVTEYGHKLLKDFEQHEAFDVLLKELEPYKYKKEVQKLDQKTQEMIQTFIVSFEK